jgi:hypothetical protein
VAGAPFVSFQRSLDSALCRPQRLDGTGQGALLCGLGGVSQALAVKPVDNRDTKVRDTGGCLWLNWLFLARLLHALVYVLG